MSSKKQTTKAQIFSAAEQRAARSERIEVREAEPYGWIAFSESGVEQNYHLFRDPETKRLACTCADFIYRGDAEPRYECKHVSATLKYIARQYLERDYDPQRQYARTAAAMETSGSARRAA
ncbi:MAG TPA: hypothetical protein VGO96_17520 [Pyrinomonadaceae bacterium]|jgi:hypothetical protein|nr:hypothetical protein [Pyrinomonadaceae bacterium]